MNSANGLLEWILFKYLNKAHIRRYLVDAVPKRKNLDYSQPAVQGILYIDRLFRLEETIKVKSTTFDSLKKARLEKEVPVIEGFPYTTLFRSYLEDGRCSFSNNLSENAIRPFTVGRKNWLFCDTPNGAQASATVYTIVEMAKANGVNVYHYLTYLLEKQPNDSMSDEELDQLAPWNEDVKAELKRRIENSDE